MAVDLFCDKSLFLRMDDEGLKPTAIVLESEARLSRVHGPDPLAL